jgi:phosphopantetheinyl transferase (holo-ACP synthase)
MSLTPAMTETIRNIESAHKNNNEWFYDRPTTDDRLETMYRQASSYATLCHKWTILNRALTDALFVMKTQQQTITDLETKIETLTKETL